MVFSKFAFNDKEYRENIGLTEEEFEERKQNLLETIPTLTGIKFLQEKAKRFEVQPWPFVSYLAHWNPELLKKGLESYFDYDGAENYHSILEGLREKHVIYGTISDLREKYKGTKFSIE